MQGTVSVICIDHPEYQIFGIPCGFRKKSRRSEIVIIVLKFSPHSRRIHSELKNPPYSDEKSHPDKKVGPVCLFLFFPRFPKRFFQTKCGPDGKQYIFESTQFPSIGSTINQNRVITANNNDTIVLPLHGSFEKKRNFRK